MNGEQQDTSSVILFQIIKKLDNIKTKIDTEIFHSSEGAGFDIVEEKRQELSPVTLITILKKVEAIEELFKKKIAYLPVEDAVTLFRAYLSTKKKPRGYYHSLDVFERDFAGRNIAEITPDEMEQFLNRHWGTNKANSMLSRHAHLNGLFNRSILALKKKGAPTFHNPMQFIVKPSPEKKDHEFVPIETIRAILNAPKLERHRIWLGILITSGIRWEELFKIRVKDIEGQVLTLWDPKSGNKKEEAVIPLSLVERLQKYITEKGLRPQDQICPIVHSAFYLFTLKYTEECGIRLTPHDFRNWCSTYWYEKAEEGMVKFVLRYSTEENRNHFNPLMQTIIEENSVPPCSVDVACKKIIGLEEDLYLYAN